MRFRGAETLRWCGGLLEFAFWVAAAGARRFPPPPAASRQPELRLDSDLRPSRSFLPRFIDLLMLLRCPPGGGQSHYYLARLRLLSPIPGLAPRPIPAPRTASAGA